MSLLPGPSHSGRQDAGPDSVPDSLWIPGILVSPALGPSPILQGISEGLPPSRSLPVQAQSYPGVESLPEEPPQLLRVALGPAGLGAVQDRRLHTLGHHRAHERGRDLHRTADEGGVRGSQAHRAGVSPGAWAKQGLGALSGRHGGVLPDHLAGPGCG